VALRSLPLVLPLSGRLQALFASRIGTLPPRTRELLLLTALDGTGDPRVLQAAATRPRALEDLAEAERARLLRVDDATHRLAFQHPLIRSAVVDLSSADEHRRAHATLADLLAEQPDRRAWHLAQSTVEPDELVAALLEETGHRALRRGDAVGAVAALMRASELSPDGADRGRRLAQAAYIGADVTGDLRAVAHLLADARRAGAQPGGSLQAAVAASFLLLMGEGDVDTAHRLLVGAIEGRGGSAADDALVEALWTLCMVCFFGGRAELWTPFHAAITGFPGVPEFLSLCGQTFADPARSSAAALEELTGAIAGLHAEADPTRILRIGIAAVYVDRVEGCREALWRVVRDGREGGAIASAINALILMGVVDAQTGRWDEADRLLDEGLALCEAHGYELLAWPGRWGQALLAALRGDQDRVDALCDRMMRWATPRRVGSVQLYARHACELAALGRGDFEEAYRQATAISPPGMLPSHIPHALWIAMDLVEAAVHTDRHAEATAHASAMREAGIAAISPRLALATGGSAAIAAADSGAAGVLFAEALTIPGIDEWPFERARVQLAYGERLRRGRATVESRVHLTAALETFEGLGARPWAARAANELRAAGQTRPRPATTERDPLTAQELEIANLAAAGLTNKQIGQRLLLSHRTVGAHLYRVFPKLGITARAALRDALASRRPE
jgi:DNA-binding CsgD family transcriptional regulator